MRNFRRSEEEGRRSCGPQAKSVGGLADQQAIKVAKAVDKLTDTFDDKTGGSASAVTAKVDEVVAGALDKAQAASQHAESEGQARPPTRSRARSPRSRKDLNADQGSIRVAFCP